MKRLLILSFLCAFARLSLAQEGLAVKPLRQKINLQGEWQFALDTGDVGIAQKWFLQSLTDKVTLPGTTDLNKKGFLNRDTTTMHLNRVYKYEGVAWYRKKVVIPAGFKGKHIELHLERTKPSKIWVDGKLVGASMLLQTPQEFDLTQYLSPGTHFITVRVDNRLQLTPYGNVHIYSDDTQTNWNGIIGELYLEASARTRITDLQVYPNVSARSISVKMRVSNPLRVRTATIELMVEKSVAGKKQRLKSQRLTRACDSVITLSYALGQAADLWDEHQRPLYKLTAVLRAGTAEDSKTVPFGMREFKAQGTQFAVNGKVTFLRGKHDACVFPLTGHPPMAVEGWLRVFKIARSYGINHYRFHSWCPPEAAFAAADQVGMYLQPELPFWGGLNTDSVAGMLRKEGIQMLKQYANHPSFVMFSHGNEIWGGHERVEKNILALKRLDPRPLYTLGSNVNIGYYAPTRSSDFFVGARTPSNGDTILTHTRLTHAFADSREGGILNRLRPGTEVNFDYPVSQLSIPIVSHEIGQYQIYPDYNEIRKYKGVLQARNLAVFRERLQKAGMLDQDGDFQKASGAWAALCYKAEMEAALRTRGFAGFQLLDLQDFPGQGTALVGILDAFMEPKNVISRQDWLMSCNDVVLLLKFPRYCWTNKETFTSTLQIANYSGEALQDEIKWEIRSQSGKILKQGQFHPASVPRGLSTVGDITLPLDAFAEAEKLTVLLSAKNTGYQNTYPLWVYPARDEIAGIKEIVVTSKYNQDVRLRLQQGEKVLLMPAPALVKGKSVGGLFPPEFWNWGMFKNVSESNKKPVSPGTLGLLMNPQHPLFKSFPTDPHTNWQWFSIVKASSPLFLDRAPAGYRPIVQVIDNLERNHKLGLIFEFKVGPGKLLVCMSDLEKIRQEPEAKQFYQSIVSYMNSGAFNPSAALAPEEVGELFSE